MKTEIEKQQELDEIMRERAILDAREQELNTESD
jgi:hypothetical protein